MSRMRKMLIGMLVAALLPILVVGLSQAQGGGPERPQGGGEPDPYTTFTYQGLLKRNGVPVNGYCDFRLDLYDASSGGSLIGRIFTSAQVTDGVFTVDVFNSADYLNGEARWLEVAVKCSGDTDYVTLEPRQPLRPVPYAMALPGLRTSHNDTSPNVIGGYSGNTVSDGVVGSTIGGGGASGGGNQNKATDNYTTIGGGIGNIAGNGDSDPLSAAGATVAGGGSNKATEDYSTVGGGLLNEATNGYVTIGGGYSNSASGWGATVGGGSNNTASGYAATVPGGNFNTASGEYSFAAGRHANANRDGCFVWADSTNTSDFTCSWANQMRVLATGGATFLVQVDPEWEWVRIMVNGDHLIDTSTDAYLSLGGVWTNASDRNAKEHFEAVDPQAVLEGVAQLPITTWNYKTEDDAVRHMGPMAQDFYAAFGLGADDEHIATVDADGVALAAIQGLYRQNQALQAENAQLRARVEALEQENASQQAQLEALEARVAALEKGSAASVQQSGMLSGAGVVLLGVGAALVRRRKGEER